MRQVPVAFETYRCSEDPATLGCVRTESRDMAVGSMIRFLTRVLVSVPALAVGLVAHTTHAEDAYPHQLPPPVRAAPDDLSGHVLLSPRVAYSVPMGSADTVLVQRDYTGAGPGVGLDVAVGVSRYAAIQGRFDYGWFARGDHCLLGEDCSAHTASFGLGIDYHLVNGASFDPWMRVGLGYRFMTFERSAPPAGQSSTLTYRGLEWLHLAIGGDWFGVRTLGFGPYLALDLGYYGSRPAQSERVAETAHHTFFSVGLRGVLDPAR